MPTEARKLKKKNTNMIQILFKFLRSPEVTQREFWRSQLS